MIPGVYWLLMAQSYTPFVPPIPPEDDLMILESGEVFMITETNQLMILE